MAGYVYVLSDPRISDSRYKIGHTSGTEEALLASYSRAQPNAIVHIFCAADESAQLEKKVLDALAEYRELRQQTGRASEWVTCELEKIAEEITRLGVDHRINPIKWDLPERPGSPLITRTETSITIPKLDRDELEELIRYYPAEVNGLLFRVGFFSVYDKRSKIPTAHKSTKASFRVEGDIYSYSANISTASEYGLPTCRDQSFYFGLRALMAYHTRRTGEVIRGNITVRKSDLFRFMELGKGNGDLYKQLDRWLVVMAASTIEVTETRLSSGLARSRTFCVFDQVVPGESPESITIRFTDGYVDGWSPMTINLGRFNQIGSDIAKTLAPVLWAWGPSADESKQLALSYRELCPILGIPYQTRAFNLARQFGGRCLEDLKLAGVVDDLNVHDGKINIQYSAGAILR